MVMLIRRFDPLQAAIMLMPMPLEIPILGQP